MEHAPASDVDARVRRPAAPVHEHDVAHRRPLGHRPGVPARRDRGPNVARIRGVGVDLAVAVQREAEDL